MKLPKRDQAAIDPRKLTDYVLSTEHDDGKPKARLFRVLLGIGPDNADQLTNALRDAAAHGEASLGRLDRYGRRSMVDFDFTGPKGKVTIRSVWIVREKQTVPDLVTCYIL